MYKTFIYSLHLFLAFALSFFLSAYGHQTQTGPYMVVHILWSFIETAVGTRQVPGVRLAAIGGTG